MPISMLSLGCNRLNIMINMLSNIGTGTAEGHEGAFKRAGGTSPKGDWSPRRSYSSSPSSNERTQERHGQVGWRLWLRERLLWLCFALVLCGSNLLITLWCAYTEACFTNTANGCQCFFKIWLEFEIKNQFWNSFYFEFFECWLRAMYYCWKIAQRLPRFPFDPPPHPSGNSSLASFFTWKILAVFIQWECGN